jgi:hypothetical protein
MLVEAYEAARALTPDDQWLDIRHEDVLADPRDTFGRVLDFVGLDWTPDFEDGFSRHTIEQHRRTPWRDELTSPQVEGIERVLAEPLSRWGYEL